MLYFFFFFDNQNIVNLSLSTLFDISVGVVDDGTQYYYLDSKENKVPVKVLRMASFDPEQKVLKNYEEIERIDKVLMQRRHENNKAINKEAPKEIEIARVLGSDDYVICTRSIETQKISGYSLLNSTVDLQPELGPVVVSHHFIHLKPRKDLQQLGYPMFIPFFHLLLDLLVEILADDTNNLSQPEKKSGKSKIKILKASKLKQYQISFPKNIMEQEKLYQEYADFKYNYETANNNFNNFKNKLKNNMKAI